MTTIKTGNYDGSVSAMRGMREGADRWTVADALLAEVGQGDSRAAFRGVAIAAEGQGVKPLSISAMRQYRDTAARWPIGERIDGVNFSAHRAALVAEDPADVLRTLAAKYGAHKVTVSKVNDEVRVRAGTAKPQRARSVSVKNATTEELLRNLYHRMQATPQDFAEGLKGASDGSLSNVRNAFDAELAARASKASKAAVWGSAPKGAAKVPAATMPKPKKAAVADLRDL